MKLDYTEMVAAIAIAILSIIFICAFLVLIVICKRQRLYYKSTSCDGEDSIMSRPEVMLIEPEKFESELDEASLIRNLEQILTNEQWIYDVTGLVPHCIAVLKICRTLTERLTALAIGPMRTSNVGLTRIVESARKISSRVDDMVRSMCPPLDPRLLEARAAALTLAVTQLTIITRYECNENDKLLTWIDKCLSEMDKHTWVLREAALIQESTSKMQTNGSVGLNYEHI
ncbi:hypothetical protein RI129_005147 [Pyrocoelia pectoralis]|uniref:Transmembrane protein 98 n=1 Tax=Pyrocoelia pectoralis TaxID=417401 RepID=A0AAN7VK72_9COLE